MVAEIIACGTELLLGQNVDTNSAYLSKVLSSIGIDVFRHVTVGDNRERLKDSIKEALSRADIVLTTGGLGPTIDDITAGTLSAVIQQDLVFNRAVLKNIKNHFKRHGSGLPKSAIKQALIPRGAEWMENSIGTAPGIIIREDKKYILALPGPPRELKPMVEDKLLPYLKKSFRHGHLIRSRSIKLMGMAEAKVNEEAAELLELKGDTTVGIYTGLGEVILRITTKAKNEKAADESLRRLEKKVRKIFGALIYGAGGETLPGVVGEKLRRSRKSLAVAESCTGGLTTNLVTNNPGSSGYLKTGLVAYDNAIKNGPLNIDRTLLKRNGAVSRPVASAMAKNVRDFGQADIGIGITGIAGPSGGTKKKPVGLVYIALSSKNKDVCEEFRFSGSREEIKYQAAMTALNLLRLKL